MFAFGTDLVVGSLGLAELRGFGCEDHSFSGAVGSSVVARWCFDSYAEEHFAAEEVGLRGVVEGVLFADARLGDGAQIFNFVKEFGDVGDAELDFDFGFCLSALGHADSIERLLPKPLACQHNLFIPRALGW